MPAHPSLSPEPGPLGSYVPFLAHSLAVTLKFCIFPASVSAQRKSDRLGGSLCWCLHRYGVTSVAVNAALATHPRGERSPVGTARTGAWCALWAEPVPSCQLRRGLAAAVPGRPVPWQTRRGHCSSRGTGTKHPSPGKGGSTVQLPVLQEALRSPRGLATWEGGVCIRGIR